MYLFENSSVRVSHSVFEVPGTQYPIRNIGAIKTYHYEIQFWSIWKVLFTVAFIPFYGLGLLIPAYWALKKFVLKSPSKVFGITVVSAGTESKAYESFVQEEIELISVALNQAVAKVAA